MPHHADDYVHRIGRTGRAGRSGEAYLLLSPADEKNFDKVIKLIKKEPSVLELDVDYSDLGDGSDQGRERSRGGRDEARGGRGRSGGRERKGESAERPARTRDSGKMQPKEELSPAPLPPAEAPRTKAAEAPAKPARTDRHSRKSEGKSNSRREPDGAFGDHMPAFMMRGPAVKS